MTFRGYSLVLCQCHVYDPAFICRHWVKSDGASISSDTVGDSQREAFQDTSPSFFIVFHVDNNTSLARISLMSDHYVCYELESSQGAAARSNQEARIVSANLDRVSVGGVVCGPSYCRSG